MNSQDLSRFRGLDMKHGFIKTIVKNQIDRDEYHKIMEERRVDTLGRLQRGRRQRSAPTREYKLYVPPHLREKSRDSAVVEDFANRRNPCPAIVSEVEETSLRERVRNRVSFRADTLQEPTSSGTGNTQSPRRPKPLFLLSLRCSSGDFVDVAVMDTDNAARLAKQLSMKHGFTDEQCRMLRLTLERELESRLLL